MAVILINKTNRIKTFNLDHPHPSIASRRKRVAMNIIEEHRSGDRLPRRATKSICDSLTVLARQRVSKFPDGTPLPDEIRAVSSIKRAVDRGEIKVITVAATPAAAEKAEEKPPAAVEGQRKTTARHGARGGLRK